jgi:hypothetical protein
MMTYARGATGCDARTRVVVIGKFKRVARFIANRPPRRQRRSGRSISTIDVVGQSADCEGAAQKANG